MYRQVLSHSSHYIGSSVQLCCTAKSHPTAVTILTDQFRSVVQQVSSHSSHYSASSMQLGFTAKSHPTAFTIQPVQGSSVVQPSLIPLQSLYCQFSAALLYIQVLSHYCHYTASSVQLCCTAKSHPTAVTILAVQGSSVVQPILNPQQSLYCQFCAAMLYSQVSSHISHYTDGSV